MKIRLVIVLVGLAMSFALPTFAQQKETVDPQIRQQLGVLAKAFEDAYNNNDPAALTALYSEDAVLVTDTAGAISGREAIGKFWADVFQKVHFSNYLITVDQNSPHIIGTAGNEMWETGSWSQTVKGQNFGPIDQKGYWASIAVRDGDAWKKQMLMWNVTPAPAK